MTLRKEKLVTSDDKKKDSKIMDKIEKFCTEYFGTYARQQLFYISPDISFTDQATWGVIPKYVLAKKFEKAEKMEQNPSAYLLENQIHDIQKVMEGVGKEFNFDPNDAVFNHSCVESLQIVLNSLDLDIDDRVLVMSDCCATISKIVRGTCDKFGCGFDKLQVPLPLTRISKLLDIFEKCLVKCNYKAFIIDHISPNSGINYPIDMLVKICKKNNVISIVYGSYAIGHIPINISKLDVDYYIGSFYRWYFSSRMVSMIYASKERKNSLWPLIENRNRRLDDTNLLNRFYSDKKCETTEIQTVGFGLEFMNHLGGLITISEYSSKLLRWAVHHLENAWGTKVFKLTRAIRAPFIAFVRLPICVERFFLNKYGSQGAHREFIKQLYGSYEISTGAKVLDNVLYCRITAHIYNTKKDYETLASAVFEMNDQLRLTTYKPSKRRLTRVNNKNIQITK